MNIVLDIILLVILIGGLVLGYKRGFIKSITKPVRFFAAIATAFWLNPIASKILEPRIKTPVTNQIRDYLLNNCPTITPETASEELPTLLKFAASVMNIDVEEKLSSVDTVSAIVETLADPVIHLISVIVTFILIYFVAKLVYSLVLSALSSMFNDGVLGFPNKILGCVFTLFLAVVVSWVFVILFDFAINSSILADAVWVKDFEGGVIYRFFAKNSPIDLLLSF